MKVMVLSQSGQVGYSASCTHDGKPPTCDTATGKHQSAAWIARRGTNCTGNPFHGPLCHDEMSSGNHSGRRFSSHQRAVSLLSIFAKITAKQVQNSHVSTLSLAPSNARKV